MAFNTRKLIVFKVIAPLRLAEVPNAVEQAVIKLLEVGLCQTVIEKMLEIDISLVVAELSQKGLLYPDGRFRKTPERAIYKQGYIFSNAKEKKFFDVWVYDYEEIEYLDIGEACLDKTELPEHYVCEKFETKYKPIKGQQAQKFSEIKWGEKS